MCAGSIAHCQLSFVFCSISSTASPGKVPAMHQGSGGLGWLKNGAVCQEWGSATQHGHGIYKTHLHTSGVHTWPRRHLAGASWPSAGVRAPVLPPDRPA